MLAEAYAASISFDKFELERNRAAERRAKQSRGESSIVEDSSKEERSRGEKRRAEESIAGRAEECRKGQRIGAGQRR